VSTFAPDRLREAKKSFAPPKRRPVVRHVVRRVDITVPACEVSGMFVPAWLRAAVALLLMLVGLASMSSAQDRAPWFGTWRLDPARGTQRATPSPYKRVTLTITPRGEQVTVIYDMVGTRGGVSHREWTGAFDGRDYPMQGVDYVMTNAYRLVNDRSYEIAVKMDGSPVAVATATVSDDGSTLTVVTRERDAGGRPVESTAVYTRVH
jgi:hypothetical protein